MSIIYKRAIGYAGGVLFIIRFAAEPKTDITLATLQTIL